MFVLPPAVVSAHDPSAWGGVYRSRDHGESWFLANEGRFVTAALAVAINPSDSRELLLATDSGLLHSRNGGRDWEIAGGGTMLGAALAVAFDADGRHALAAVAGGLFRTDDGVAWHPLRTPLGAMPVRELVSGATPGRVYLAGWDRLFRSDDWGGTWSAADEGLSEGAPTSLVVVPGLHETLLAVSAGTVWVSLDGAGTWQPRSNGLPLGRVDTVVRGADADGSLWAAGEDRLFRSVDLGATWHQFGAPLVDAATPIRGIAVAADSVSAVVTTDRGLYRSGDGAASWELLVDNVPVHLEARPLVRDPRDPATLYAGFSITPYDALWRNAAEGGSPLLRLGPIDLAGGLAFLVLLGLVSGVVLQRLGRYYARAEGHSAGNGGPIDGPATGLPLESAVARRVTDNLAAGTTTG